MNFCAIGPLAAGSIFQEHSHHMALAQYLYDHEYFTFMTDRVREGKFVVLDSGVYENAAVDERQLLYWCLKLRPSAVVLPDKPYDADETLKRSLSFADKLDGAKLTSIKKWKVLHAAADAFTTFHKSYLYDSRLFDAVCFSRLVTRYGVCQGRVRFIRWLQTNGSWNPKCYHHALGMMNGSLTELQELKSLGINSCDSSAPIWRPWSRNVNLSNEATSFDISFDPFSPSSNHLERTQSSFEKVISLCASK